MKRMTICAILAACVGLTGCTIVRNPEAEAAAIDVAEVWLALVDNGQYGDSWQETAGVFRDAVAEEKWVETMESLRKPLGRNLSRDIKSIRYRTTLPGVPDGEYVIIQFRASFENKKYAVETITPMLDQDGTWRVSGYYMK